MQIENLQIFCDLVESKSFSRAGEKNFVSQSAVSQQVSQFEMEFKCQLLDRKKRPFELTEAGKVFYKACREILTTFQRFKSDLSQMSSESRVSIKISAIFSIGMHILQEFVRQFMSKYPTSNVELDFANSDKIYKDVLAGQIDIGIVAVPKKDRHFDVFDFVDDELVLVCSKKHPLADEADIDIHRLQMERFITFGKDVPTGQLIDSILQKYGVVVNTVMEFDNTETIKRAVEINSGISILPISTVTTEHQAGTLCVLRFTNERLIRPSGVVIRKNRVLSEQTKYFIELLTGEKGKIRANEI
jgi:DNA-binding transcriptional LysR family regulator